MEEDQRDKRLKEKDEEDRVHFARYYSSDLPAGWLYSLPVCISVMKVWRTIQDVYCQTVMQSVFDTSTSGCGDPISPHTVPAPLLTLPPLVQIPARFLLQHRRHRHSHLRLQQQQQHLEDEGEEEETGEGRMIEEEDKDVRSEENSGVNKKTSVHLFHSVSHKEQLLLMFGYTVQQITSSDEVFQEVNADIFGVKLLFCASIQSPKI
ncbi:hypothetical protein ABVT39_017595 [Epinephelus coioides]